MSLEVSDFRPRSLHNLQLRELAGASGGREPLGDLVEEEGDGTPGCDGEHASRRPRKEGARTFGAVQVRRDRRRTAPLSDRRLQPRLDEVRRRGEQRRGSGGGAGARGRGRGRKLRLVGDARVTRNEVAPVLVREEVGHVPRPPRGVVGPVPAHQPCHALGAHDAPQPVECRGVPVALPPHQALNLQPLLDHVHRSVHQAGRTLAEQSRADVRCGALAEESLARLVPSKVKGASKRDAERDRAKASIQARDALGAEHREQSRRHGGAREAARTAVQASRHLLPRLDRVKGMGADASCHAADATAEHDPPGGLHTGVEPAAIFIRRHRTGSRSCP
mmetsp:Transcript_298/g.887  ORF Transcript_298/g.887 Transcript_298/m.887 type:complete len:334 (-) Transcript_298:133-1134(-)